MNMPLEKLALVEKSRTNVNRVAPITQIDVHNLRRRCTGFTRRLIHHLRRLRRYLRLGFRCTQVNGAVERRPESGDTVGLDPERELGGVEEGGFGGGGLGGERDGEGVGCGGYWSRVSGSGSGRTESWWEDGTTLS